MEKERLIKLFGYILLGGIGICPIVALFVLITTPLGVMPWSSSFNFNVADWCMLSVLGVAAVCALYGFTYRFAYKTIMALRRKG